MSLTSSPDGLFRPEDKVLRMLFPSVEEPFDDSANEFLTDQPYGSHSEEISDNSRDRDQDQRYDEFDRSIRCWNHAARVDKLERDTPQPWRKGLWCLSEKVTSPLGVEKTRQVTRGHQGQLVSNEILAARSPRYSPPPNVKNKNDLMSARMPTAYGQQYVRMPISREQTLSPSPMYAQLPPGGAVQHESWQQDFQNFHLQATDEKQSAPPTSVHQAFQRLNNARVRQLNAVKSSQNGVAARAPQSPTRYHYPFQHVPRPTSDQEDVDAVFTNDPPARKDCSAYTAGVDNSTVPIPYQYVEVEPGETPVWTTQSLYSSDSSQYSHNTQSTHDSHQQTYMPLPQQVWLSSPVQNAQVAFPGHHQQLYGNLAAPMPYHAPHPLLYPPQDAEAHVLDTGFVGAGEIGRTVDYEPAGTSLNYSPSKTPSQSSMPTSNPFLDTYPPLPPYPTERFSVDSPFATPRRRTKSKSRSPSPPSISPTHKPTARSSHQRSPSRPEQRHGRRKSIHKTGPVKESSNSNSHNDNEGNFRARSSSRPPKTPRTPKTPTAGGVAAAAGGGAVEIGFVNYTSRDSAKLMADVAPSGSSKTRARREQEAKEKRKKLGEAALQAVKRAGGDVSALERAIRVP